MTRQITFAVLAFSWLVPGPLAAQSKWTIPDDMKKLSGYVKVPIFAELKDDPALPRVLLIGDSISMYYTPEVRAQLHGKANVYRVPDNGKSTLYGLKNLEYWLGDGKWAVIHFNFGLHDIAVLPATGKQQVSLADYEKNLRVLVKRLKTTGAKLIWASTTPVPEGSRARHETDAVAYNAVAKKIMEENQIPINDLHAFVEAKRDKATMQWPANVHFRAEGSADLATEVAKHIFAALRK
jgi:acyl-CoA thioesterase-1